MSKFGWEGKAYSAAAALTGTTPNIPEDATWTLQDGLTDVNTGVSTSEGDFTTRANNGWRSKKAGLKEGEVTFEMIWEPADALFTLIQAAFFGGTTVPMAFMDGAIATAGSQGLVANFAVTRFERQEPLEGPMKVAVTLSPYSEIEWYTTAA